MAEYPCNLGNQVRVLPDQSKDHRAGECAIEQWNPHRGEHRASAYLMRACDTVDLQGRMENSAHQKQNPDQPSVVVFYDYRNHLGVQWHLSSFVSLLCALYNPKLAISVISW